MKEVRLKDGQYRAKCKEKTILAAFVAGHSFVFPEADLTVANGWARFYKDGKEVPAIPRMPQRTSISGLPRRNADDNNYQIQS